MLRFARVHSLIYGNPPLFVDGEPIRMLIEI